MAARKARGGMPAGGSAATIETEIERAREEGNWKRVMQLAEQLRGRQVNERLTLNVRVNLSLDASVISGNEAI